MGFQCVKEKLFLKLLSTITGFLLKCKLNPKLSGLVEPNQLARLPSVADAIQFPLCLPQYLPPGTWQCQVNNYPVTEVLNILDNIKEEIVFRDV